MLDFRQVVKTEIRDKETGKNKEVIGVFSNRHLLWKKVGTNPHGPKKWLGSHRLKRTNIMCNRDDVPLGSNGSIFVDFFFGTVESSNSWKGLSIRYGSDGMIYFRRRVNNSPLNAEIQFAHANASDYPILYIDLMAWELSEIYISSDVSGIHAYDGASQIDPETFKTWFLDTFCED